MRIAPTISTCLIVYLFILQDAPKLEYILMKLQLTPYQAVAICNQMTTPWVEFYKARCFNDHFLLLYNACLIRIIKFPASGFRLIIGCCQENNFLSFGHYVSVIW